MPIHKAKDEHGKEGWQWGDHGKVYTGPDGKKKAQAQAAAAHANGFKEPKGKREGQTSGQPTAGQVAAQRMTPGQLVRQPSTSARQPATSRKAPARPRSAPKRRR